MSNSRKVPKVFYDPSIPYEWAADDIFSLKGIEFEYIFKFLTEYLNTPDSVKVVKAYETHKILEQKLKEGVEKGIVKPSKA